MRREPNYRVEESKCEKKTPSYVGKHWFVPKNIYRKSLIRKLEYRLDLLDRNEFVERSSKTSEWHCKTCRANDTRGYLNYIHRVIEEEIEEKREDIRSARLIRITQKTYDTLKRHEERELQHQQRVFEQAYPTFQEQAKFIDTFNRLFPSQRNMCIKPFIE